MPDGRAIEGLDAARYRAMRLLLPLTPLGVEIEAFACWVEDNSAADGREPLRIVIKRGQARAEGDHDGDPLDRWRRVWRMLEGLGVAVLELDARLESNQITDVFTLLLSQRRRLNPGRPRRSCDTVERLRSEGGIAFSCTVTRLVDQRL